MEFVVGLWLPILVGTIALWFLSVVAWLMLPHHFGDFQKVEIEDQLMDLIRDSNIPPGNYMFPQAGSKKEQDSKEFGERYAKGPRGTLNIYNIPNMPVNIGKTVLFFFVTVFTIAYITSVACPEGTEFMRVFRIAGTIGVLTYATSNILHRVWFTARMLTDFIDGVVYGIVVGLVFALLWW